MKIEFNQKPLPDSWIGLCTEYPTLTKRDVKTLMPFATTYLCEWVLSSHENKIQAQTGKRFKTQALKFSQTLRSYVHPLNHTLLINLC